MTYKKYEGQKPTWEDFLKSLQESFPQSFVQDYSFTGGFCSCFKAIIPFWDITGKDYKLVLHSSCLMPYHAYYINEKEHRQQHEQAEPPYMTEAMLEELYRNPPPPPPFKRYWNEAPPAIAPIVDQILEAYIKLFARTQLFSTELLHYRVLQVATQRREMHEATMFDLLFTDIWEDA
ncbi:hypothetical protein QNI19_28005 [Cytophagaceae bacterium DM2B3-1]|uniref:Uncharacterized protein n=1 Tax=Xanthocytophaga flava TaxID=3048013 RepID=A0ABT7CT14_9BACT|nr:hypothetical protein [Xanthocytophaga flavus]MDJ1496811.1 hypothetical protein [Xanthocytophaga flavus]